MLHIICVYRYVKARERRVDQLLYYLARATSDSATVQVGNHRSSSNVEMACYAAVKMTALVAGRGRQACGERQAGLWSAEFSILPK